MTKETLARFDLEGMHGAIQAFSDQLKDGRARALKARTDGWPNGTVTGVVIAGMGGSAIGGDILCALAINHASIPIVVSRSYSLPAWVDSSTVVVASSYSGNTEETLTAFDEAYKRGAQLIVISTGGELGERAAVRNIPYVQLPSGIQPRAALPYSLSALLTATEAVDLTDIQSRDWDEAIRITSQQSDELSDFSDPQNQAIKLAGILAGHIPVVYSSEQLGVANIRWRNQIHENSKSLAVGNMLPEMNHNEVMGWARFSEELKQMAVIALRDIEDHERTQRRLDITRSLLEPHAHSWNEVHSLGHSRLARLLSIIYFGDWVSLYLAILNETDPSPVGLISQLKAALVQGE